MTAWDVYSSTSLLSPYFFNFLNPHRFWNFVNYPLLKIKVFFCSSGDPVLASSSNLSPFFLIKGPFNRRLQFACSQIHTNKAALSFGAAPLRRRIFPISLERVAVSCVDNFFITRDIVDLPGALGSLNYVSHQWTRLLLAVLSFSRLHLSISLPRTHFWSLSSVSYGIYELCCWCTVVCGVLDSVCLFHGFHIYWNER